MAVVWPMFSVFSTVRGSQPPHSPWPPHMSPVILGGSGPHAHRVTLGITALGCGFPPAGHLQFGLLFHPRNLHHPSQLHHLSSVLLDVGGARWVGGAPVFGAPPCGFALGHGSLVMVLGGGHSFPPSLVGPMGPWGGADPSDRPWGHPFCQGYCSFLPQLFWLPGLDGPFLMGRLFYSSGFPALVASLWQLFGGGSSALAVSLWWLLVDGFFLAVLCQVA